MVYVKIFGQFSSTLSGELMKFEENANVDDVKRTVAEKLGANSNLLSLYYCDKELNDGRTLDTFDFLNDKSILYVFSKPVENLPYSAVPTSNEIDQLLASMQATVADPAHRTMLFRIASDPDTLQNLIDCIPGLRNDLVALAVLRDPFLLLHWVENENVSENFTKHPSLFTACQQLIEHMHAEILRHNDSSASDLALLQAMPNEFGARFVGDDEEESDSDDGPNNFNVGAAQGNQHAMAAGPSTPRQQITPQYLAAALAAATGLRSEPGSSANFGAMAGGGNMPPSSRTSSASLNLNLNTANPNPNILQQQSGRLITPEMFRQAVQQAFPSVNHYESQLAELRSMGFTNDEENVRALTQSGGEVQSALEYIINERERLERENFGLD